MDLKEDCTDYIHERPMGEMYEYRFDREEECASCGQTFRIKGSIFEYPCGAYDSETIEVNKA